MPVVHPIDGSLPAWDEIEDEADWEALLFGNGLSINAWPDFAYASLYQQAKLGDEHCRLDHEDLALFDEFETENFELVLGSIDTAIRTTTALERDASALIRHYQSIQRSLGGAVRSVHIRRLETPDLTLEAIKRTMERHKAVFTTSYDLLTYWAMGYPDRDYGSLVDLFWSEGPNGPCEFDPNNTDLRGRVPIYFLHGALHLIAHGTGATRKLICNEDETVLEQFGQPIEGDPHARPLLISEGSSEDKLRAIQANAYLTHALDKLSSCELPLVVFGSALGEHDMHIVDALNERPDRPIAVSMLPGEKIHLRALQGEIRSRLETHELHFYNAETYPLGDPHLVCPPCPPSRKR
jgi:hypothetical protein